MSAAAIPRSGIQRLNASGGDIQPLWLLGTFRDAANSLCCFWSTHSQAYDAFQQSTDLTPTHWWTMQICPFPELIQLPRWSLHAWEGGMKSLAENQLPWSFAPSDKRLEHAGSNMLCNFFFVLVRHPLVKFQIQHVLAYMWFLAPFWDCLFVCVVEILVAAPVSEDLHGLHV